VRWTCCWILPWKLRNRKKNRKQMLSSASRRSISALGWCRILGVWKRLYLWSFDTWVCTDDATKKPVCHCYCHSGGLLKGLWSNWAIAVWNQSQTKLYIKQSHILKRNAKMESLEF
jgi:hypothetical protein